MLKFDPNGNLYDTHILNFQQVCKELGNTTDRKNLLASARIFLKIFKSLGCSSIYLVGSFVSREKNPKDIDLCIDITYVDYSKLKKLYPDFFASSGIESIKKRYNCHIIFFDSYSLEILDWFRKDKNDNPKGLIKVVLDDMILYDKE